MSRWITLFALLCSAVVGTTTQAAVTVTTIGTPGYLPVDSHLFSGPIGTAADGFAEFAQTQGALLPPPNHLPNPALGIGPGSPHAGPYTTEFGQGVTANGFVDADIFTAAQYSNGNGVYLVFMMVPAGGSPNGSSPDFTSGPIIPNALFPLTVTGSTFTDGVLNDSLGAFTVPPLNAAVGFPGVDGHSHTPFFFVDNFDFASLPAIAGDYEYRIGIRDSAGNGYDIAADFQVLAAPEPPSWILLGIGCLAVGGLSQKSRKVFQSRQA
jgi:hypothetical protein